MIANTRHSHINALARSVETTARLAGEYSRGGNALGEGRNCIAAAELRLKSRAESRRIVDKFPLQRGGRHPERVFTELLGRQLAIDFRPRSPRSRGGALCRVESDWKWILGVASRWSNIIGKNCPIRRRNERPFLSRARHSRAALSSIYQN